MKHSKLFAIPVAVLLLLGFNDVTAQEAKRMDNAQWKSVVMVDFHAGKEGRAQEIIDMYYRKAAEKAGTPTPELVIDLETGEWDMMIIWHMQGGIDDMNWEVHPNGVKWRQALNEVCGGEDKAAEILNEYSGLIARSTSAIGHSR